MKQATANSIAPLFLRLALGATFLWAGLGKVQATFPVKGEFAALLANMGVSKLQNVARPLTTPISTPAVAPPAPRPEIRAIPTTPDPAPADTKPAQAKPEETKPEEAKPSEAKPSETKPTQGPQASLGGGLFLAQVTAPPNSSVPVGPSPRRFVAADFPDEVEVERVYGLTLVIHRAANPAPTDAVQEPMRLWPKRLSQGSWPLALAWGVAITEIVAGLFVVVGLLTRISASALASVMLGAMWLTEFGPAMQSGSAVWGFLPNRPLFGLEESKTLLWQFALLCSSIALAFTGSGTIAFDRRLFPPAPPAPRIKPLL